MKKVVNPAPNPSKPLENPLEVCPKEKKDQITLKPTQIQKFLLRAAVFGAQRKRKLCKCCKLIVLDFTRYLEPTKYSSRGDFNFLMKSESCSFLHFLFSFLIWGHFVLLLWYSCWSAYCHQCDVMVEIMLDSSLEFYYPLECTKILILPAGAFEMKHSRNELLKC